MNKSKSTKAVEKKSVWEVLSAVDVSSHTEKKGNLTYLSWAWTWAEVKKRFPSATYYIYRNPHSNQQWDYQEGVGYMCSTSVTIQEETLEMWLPVMDFRNKSMVSNATTFDINKTIMRCLTKNLAMFGLGHYIYAGEDLPNSTADNLVASPSIVKKKVAPKKSTKKEMTDEEYPKILKGAKQYQKTGLKEEEILNKLFEVYLPDQKYLQKLRKELYGK